MLSENILQHIGQRLAPRTITAVTHLPNSTAVPDSTEKYTIRTTDDDFVFIISSEVSPLMVKRATDRQREAKAHLRGPAAELIELPLLEGFIGEKSYAVWLRRQPLSSNRIRSKIEKMLLAPRVYRWLRDIASQTATSCHPSKLAANIRMLQEFSAIPTSFKDAAEKAYKAFCSGTIPAVQVMQHGDLWIGNILKAPSKTGFIVIDWPGARIDGAPFFDLVKFSLSVGASRFKLRHEILAHSRMLGCNPQDASAYVLSGLGILHSELEYFPESSFVELCEQKMFALNAAISS